MRSGPAFFKETFSNYPVMKNRLWDWGASINPRSIKDRPDTGNLPCEPLTADSSVAHLTTVLNYLCGLRKRWERGEPVSLSMLACIYPDQAFKSGILTCEDADAHLFSTPLHALIAHCERQLAENQPSRGINTR